MDRNDLRVFKLNQVPSINRLFFFKPGPHVIFHLKCSLSATDIMSSFTITPLPHPPNSGCVNGLTIDTKIEGARQLPNSLLLVLKSLIQLNKSMGTSAVHMSH